ncbi:MAG: class B sortase [Clostridium sp.]
MKIIKFIINMILVGVISICGYKVLDKNVKYKKADEVYEFIRNEKEDVEQGGFQIENDDYRGWIKINNTNIDYPILQGNDNIYYLDKDMNGEYLISGSIFMNYANNGFEDKITVLFGHNMKNGTMFADLNKYKQKDFFYGNNNIGIETNNGDYLEYEVFSVYVTDAKENYIKTNFVNENEQKEFLDKIQNKSLYQSDIEIDEDDKIITLSTCSYEFNDARLVVHGRLLN